MIIRPDPPASWWRPLPSQGSEEPPSDRFEGARFLEKKPWHWPWADPNREIDPTRVPERLARGETGLSVQTEDASLPVALHSPQDLEDLAACRSDRPGLSHDLQALAADGWHFHSDSGEVGVYGAFEGLTEDRYPVTARRDAVRVDLGEAQKVERLARFYDPGQLGPAARLEREGYAFFDPQGRPVAAFEAGPDSRVGRGQEAWLPAQSPPDAVRTFARLRALASSPQEVAAVLALEGDESRKFTAVTAMRRDPQVVELALAATRPEETALRAELPALIETHGPEAAARVLDHLSDPVAAAVRDWKAPVRSRIYAELRTAASTPGQLKELCERVARQVPEAAGPMAAVCLEQSLPRAAAGDLESVSALALRCQDPAARKSALDFMLRLPECAGIKQAWDELGPELRQPAQVAVLLAHPRLGTDDASQQPVAEELLRSLEKEPARRKLALQRLEALLARPEADRKAVSQQAQSALRLGEVEAARRALQSLVRHPECAQIKQVLECAEPVLTTDLGRKVLYKCLLSDPELSDDPVRRRNFESTLLAYMENDGVAPAERRAVAAARLEALLAGTPEPLELASLAAYLVGQGEEATARKALARLASLPEGAGLKRALAEIEPECGSPTGRSLFYKRLLARPDLGADDVSQQQLTQEVLSAWNSSGLPKTERVGLARHCLERMLAHPLGADQVGAVANQARHLLSLDDLPAARQALTRLAALPECAGLAQAMQEHEPHCATDRARELLYSRLLAQPELSTDATAQQRFCTGLLETMDSYGLPRGERSALASARLERLLAAPADVATLASQATLCARLDDLKGAARTLDRLASLPECAGLARARAVFSPACSSELAGKVLTLCLLAAPQLGTDLETQSKFTSDLLLQLESYGVPLKERVAAARAALEPLLAQPLRPELVGPVAARGASLVQLDQPQDGLRALRYLAPACPTLEQLDRDLRPLCPSKAAGQQLTRQLLSEPQVSDRGKFVLRLAASLESQGVSAGERRKLLSHELDQALTGPPDHWGALAREAARVGDKTALHRAAEALGRTGAAGAVLSDWLPLVADEKSKNCLREALLDAPPPRDGPAARKTVRQEWLRRLTAANLPVEALKRDLDRWEADRAARQEVGTLARPDRTTAISDQDGQLVVGGVVVPKKR